ncbi:Transferase [Macleaya cordata]|uniref:Transferase n=1 Tax=Macleaya cordata TaxID=56857 RepID=A0A200QZK2_MACCD|nr:Transferase [Macleaya cordata]
MSFAEVRCVSTSTVRPASYNETTQQIELASWDLMCLRIHYMQKGLLFTKPKQEEEEANMIISHLKTSLSYTLDHFFPLAGRLGITKHDDDNTISIYINCNSAGVEFIHAAADITVADILTPTYVPRIVDSFFSLNGVMNYEGQSQPLLSVQVTELIDGIFIGCSINHSVCDGTSFWHFINSWSEISRGSSSNHISRPPVLKRWFLNNTDFPIHLPYSSIDEMFPEKYIPAPFEEKGFHFTRENIARLKAKANSEIETDHNNISSLQALLAHVWVAVTRARCLDPNEETRYLVVMGNRTRLNPPLPETYFGNSVGLGIATAKAGELINRGFGWGASLLNEAVISHDDTSIRSMLKSWMEKPIVPSVNNDWVSNTLTARSSPRFNMYGNDFGWGRPIAVRTGMSDKYDGITTLSPGPVEGSVDIEVCLPVEKLKAIEDDVEFMEAVTVLPPFLQIV